MTIDRAVALVALAFVLLRLSHPFRLPREVLPLVIASIIFLGVSVGGLLYSPALATGQVKVGNIASGLLVFFLSMVLSHHLLRTTADPRVAEAIAAAPLWGFLPSGLLGIYQAGQLIVGSRPTIPLLSYSRLDSNSLNSARTAFGSGLNEFSLDRIAAATGDPPTFGILCSLTLAYALWAHRSRLIRSSRLFWVVLAVASIGVVVSASVSAMLVVAVALVLNRPRNLQGWRQLAMGSAALMISLLLILTVVPAVNGFIVAAERRVGAGLSGAGSGGQHLDLASDAINLFSAHPVLGVGTGGLSFHQYGADLGFSSVHNTLLLAFAEGGIIAGLPLLLLWFILGKRCVAIGVLVPCIAAWLFYLDFARLPSMWVLMGVSVSLGYWIRQKLRGEATPRMEALADATSSARF